MGPRRAGRRGPGGSRPSTSRCCCAGRRATRSSSSSSRSGCSATFPDATLVEFPDARTFVSLDQPERLAEEIGALADANVAAVTQEPTRARFPDFAPRSGGYESFYVKAAAPDRSRAVWIRYTIHQRAHEAPRGSMWFTWFESGADGPLASKVTVATPARGCGGRGAAHRGGRLRTGSLAGRGAVGRPGRLVAAQLRRCRRTPVAPAPRVDVHRTVAEDQAALTRPKGARQRVGAPRRPERRAR